MSDVLVARVSLKTGTFEFNADGDPEWLAKHLDKVLAAATSAPPKPAPKPSK